MKRFLLLLSLLVMPLAYAGDVTISQGSGSGAVTLSASSTTNAFETVDAPAGTDPVADSSTDTLTLTESSTPLSITGNSSTDTLAFDLDADSITATYLADTDFGDFTCDDTVSGCLVDANAIDLAVDTMGNYVATLVDDGSGTMSITNSGTEDAGVTIGLAGDGVSATYLADTDFGDFTCADGAGGCLVDANSIALGTDTTGNYVLDVADGTGIDGTASGEGTTYTPTFDATELSALTWSAGGSASLLWTWNLSGTDPTLTAESGQFTIGGDLDLSDTTPHVRLIPASGDAFETYAFGSEWWLTNVTDGKPWIRVTATDQLAFPQLASCDTIDTDALGRLSCGTDSGGGGNSFETMAVPAGTHPVADSATDTLTITETSFLTITGTPATDTIAITQVTTDLGTDGLITANAVDSAELATDSVSADELNATGVEAELESALDIGGEVTSAGMASTVIADSVTVASWTLQGATMTAELFVDATGAEFEPGDALTDCSTFAATGGGIFYDDSEGKLKKCQDNTLTDLDTSGAFDSTAVDATTWSDGANASNAWTFDVSGTDHTMTAGSANMTFSHDITVSGGDLLTGNITFRLGDATTDSITLTTDGTGTGEVVLPNNSIGAAELASGALPPREIWIPCAALIPVEAADSIPPLTKDAGTNLDQLVCAFNADADEGRTGSFLTPSRIESGSTVTFTVVWYSAAATTGDAVWNIRHNSGTAADVDPDVALTALTATDTTAGTAGQASQTAITETQTNLAWVAGDLIYFTLHRDANNVADDLAGDALVIGVNISIPQL